MPSHYTRSFPSHSLLVFMLRVLWLSVDFYTITGIIWFVFIIPDAPSHDLCVMSVPLTVAVKSLYFSATHVCSN
jgi:hypothetical protein